MSVKSFVDGLISAKKVVVFSKSYCPYCHKVRDILNDQKLVNGALEWVELDSRPDCNEIQDYLGELTGARSVPRVFVNGISLGGCDDTASYAKSGRLHSLLLECQGTYM